MKAVNIKSFKSLLPMVMAFFFGLSVSSCNDSDLADALEGIWLSDEIETAEGDGAKFLQQTYYEFAKTDDAVDGGKFFEEVSGTFTMEDEGLVMSGTVISRISGTWEVLMGDLCLTYDMSSLTVDVADVDASLADDADEVSQLAFMDAHASGEFDKANLKEEMQNMVYEDLKSQYQADNDEGNSFSNLKVENGMMSFKTGDIGVMTFRKMLGKN